MRYWRCSKRWWNRCLAIASNSFLTIVQWREYLSSATEHRNDSAQFEQLSRGLLASGHQIRFQARGRSMLPLIRDGETLRVESVPARTLRIGDIIVAKTPRGLRAHRLIFKDIQRDCFLTRGDAGQESDPPISAQHII